MNIPSINVSRFLLISVLALLSLSPSSVKAWAYQDDRLVQKSYLVEQTAVISNSVSIKIDGTLYSLEIDHGEGILNHWTMNTPDPLWRSPEEWNVREGFFADLNQDGAEELVLLVWRRFQPWPVDRFLPKGGRITGFQDSEGKSSHIILLGWKNGTFEEVWAGSAMASPMRELHAADLDEDDVVELVGLEYSYDDNDNTSSLVVWEWNGFGFSLGDRKTGINSTLSVVQDKGEFLLLVQ